MSWSSCVRFVKTTIVVASLLFAGALVAEDEKSEPTSSPSLKVRVLDKEGKPVGGVTVLVYDGNNYWAGLKVRFESLSNKTNKEGIAEFPAIPAEHFRVQINIKSPKYSGSYIYLSRGKLLGTDPLIKVESTKELITATFTLHKHINLQFTVHDDETGNVLKFLTVHFKDHRVDDWTLLSLIDAGGQHNFTTIIEEMSRAEFLAAKQGYYPTYFKLEVPLAVGQEFHQFVPLKPAPRIRLTVLGPDGKLAHGANYKVDIPKGMEAGSSARREETDREGRVIMPYPGLGDLVRIQVFHESGTAEVAVKDLPKPKLVEVDGENSQLIEHQVQLRLAR